jgi:hypothetical protein
MNYVTMYTLSFFIVMVMQSYFIRFLILFFAFNPHLALAVQATGLGDVAESLIAPVGLLYEFISAAAIIIGITCLFGAFIRYTQFRINPVAAPISSVITLIVLGIALLCLPFLKTIDFFNQ